MGVGDSNYVTQSDETNEYEMIFAVLQPAQVYLYYIEADCRHSVSSINREADCRV